MISACTTSTESQLARLGDLMGLLGATASSSGMDLALTHATAWAERYITGRTGGVIRRQVYEETLPGTGSQRLMVGNVPLWGVQRLFDDTSTGDATEYCSTDYRIEDREAGFITRTSNAGYAWTAIQDVNLTSWIRPNSETRPWLVVYEAGWQLLETSETAQWVTTSTYRTLPEDIERAVLLKAADIYQGSPQGIESMRVGPLAVNYGSESADAAGASEALLSPYRRLA